jgi:hypothetical protein
MPKALPKTPLPAAGWIVVCAFCNCAGWGLSAIHELNLAGYSIAMLVGLAAAMLWWKRSGGDGGWEGFKPRKLLRRFRRPFALAFLVLAALAFLGGLLYAPVNYDALAYRTPRVLNWLAEGRWYWIHTDFARLNARTCGFEWLMAPFAVFTGTDRGFFLANMASFLLLPGLIYSVLTRAGVRRLTAWHWMWIIPTSYCYLLQAGSIANDMFGAVFSLAAVDFALRARESGRPGGICLSVLAAALLTGAKASNLPLLLPWLIAFLSAWRVWLRRPLMLCAIAVPAAACSFLPTVVLNQRYCGDWTGLSAEHVTQEIGNCPVWVRLLNNTITDTLQNVVPPVFPLASQWNNLADRLIPSGYALVLQQHFEAGPAHWRLDEMAVEENSGLGFGVTLLLAASLAAVALNHRRRPATAPASGDWWLKMICIAPWVALIYTMSKLGLSSGARYMAPYYPLLLMGLLRGGAHAQLVKQKWWRGCAVAGFVLALALVVISPARPLWPAGWVMNHYGARLQASRLGTRVFNVYSVYAARAEAFAPVRDSLPKDEKVVGLVTFDDPETSLWRPFGTRRILHVLQGDSAAYLQAEGIRYVLVGKLKFAQLYTEPFDSWLTRVNGKVVSRFELHLRAGTEPTEWVVVRLSPAGSAESAHNSRAPTAAGDERTEIKSSPPVAPGVKVPA